MIPDSTQYNDSPEYIAGLVARAQEASGLTQRGVARQIGVGYTSLKDWMSGMAKISFPGLYALEKLANA